MIRFRHKLTKFRLSWESISSLEYRTFRLKSFDMYQVGVACQLCRRVVSQSSYAFTKPRSK